LYLVGDLFELKGYVSLLIIHYPNKSPAFTRYCNVSYG